MTAKLVASKPHTCFPLCRFIHMNDRLRVLHTRHETDEWGKSPVVMTHACALPSASAWRGRAKVDVEAADRPGAGRTAEHPMPCCPVMPTAMSPRTPCPGTGLGDVGVAESGDVIDGLRPMIKASGRATVATGATWVGPEGYCVMKPVKTSATPSALQESPGEPAPTK